MFSYICSVPLVLYMCASVISIIHSDILRYKAENEAANLYSEIKKINIPKYHLENCREYAKYLIDSYHHDTYKILTMGKQCLLINASLHEMLGTSNFENYIIPRPISGLRQAVEYCISQKTGRVNYRILNNFFDKIIPVKNTLENKTLIISRNLCLIETISFIKPYLERYFDEKGILYHFDFAISSSPLAEYIDDEYSETTREQYYDRVKLLEDDIHVTIWEIPSENINENSVWFRTIMELDIDYFKYKSNRELVTYIDTFIHNEKHKSLLMFLRNAIDKNKK